MQSKKSAQDKSFCASVAFFLVLLIIQKTSSAPTTITIAIPTAKRTVLAAPSDEDELTGTVVDSTVCSEVACVVSSVQFDGQSSVCCVIGTPVVAAAVGYI